MRMKPRRQHRREVLLKTGFTKLEARSLSQFYLKEAFIREARKQRKSKIVFERKAGISHSQTIKGIRMQYRTATRHEGFSSPFDMLSKTTRSFASHEENIKQIHQPQIVHSLSSVGFAQEDIAEFLKHPGLLKIYDSIPFREMIRERREYMGYLQRAGYSPQEALAVLRKRRGATIFDWLREEYRPPKPKDFQTAARARAHEKIEVTFYGRER